MADFYPHNTAFSAAKSVKTGSNSMPAPQRVHLPGNIIAKVVCPDLLNYVGAVDQKLPS